MNEMYLRNMKGCTDHGCLFQDNSKGMGTNGGCQCEKELRRTVEGRKASTLIRYLRLKLTRLQQEVSEYQEGE